MISSFYDWLLAGRTYVGPSTLLLNAIATYIVIKYFLHDGMKMPWILSILLYLPMFSMVMWATQKPPTPPRPPLPPLSEYARIYARPEWGGSSTNKILNVTPKGKVRVINE